MPRTWKSLTLLFAILLAAGLIAGCSDDDPSGPVDDAAPLITDIDPSMDEVSVSMDEPVRIRFNEIMDTVATEAAVTLSHGTVTSADWDDDDKMLILTHTPWSQGEHVTVTVGTEAADLAGNVLEADYVCSFWVRQETFEVLAIDPPSGSTGVMRNPVVKILFSSSWLNYTSLENATTISDSPIPMKATYPVEFSGAEGDWVQMSFDQTLPPSTTFYGLINTSAQDGMGTHLESPFMFQFTTGTDADTTPPELLDVWPESGSVIDRYTPYIQFTFSEPVDLDSFEFKGCSAVFYIMIMEMGEPQMLEGGAVMRLPLPNPLPPGHRLEVLFDEFADIFGNTQTDDLDYGVTVEGTPDYYPATDGLKYGMYVREMEGTIGNQTPTWTHDYDEYYRIDTQTGDEFLLKLFPSYEYLDSHEWDIYSKTGSAILIHGFHEGYPMPPVKVDMEEQDILFDDPLTWLKLPPRVTSWTESTTFIEPDSEMTADLDVEGRIIEKIDELHLDVSKAGLPAIFSSSDKADMGIYWTDCWKAVIEHTISADGTTFIAGSDTVWYAPNIGPVRQHSYEEEYEGDGGEWEDIYKTWFPVGEEIR